MAFTKTDLDNVNAAIASGELRVRSSTGSEVIYRSMDDLLKARAAIEADLAAAAAGSSRRSNFRFTFGTSRGH